MERDGQSGGNRRHFLMWLPPAITACVYLASAFGRAVIDYDEGYYSQAAQQMLVRGDWVTPYANGVRFLEKPPLMYWLTAASMKVFGVNEIALRLPAALAVIALVIVVMRMARRTAGERAAFISGLCIAFCAGTYLFTIETLHDIWLVLFVTLALQALLEWHLDDGHSFRHAALFYAALAGAVMTKSLVGVAFPAGIVVVFYLLMRRWPDWRKLYLVPGILLFLLLAVPWHLVAALRNPGFLYAFFVNEQFLRFFGRHDPPVLWSLPLIAFWALIPVWFFPWTAFLPAAARASRKPAGHAQQALVRLVLAWLIVILGFYSVSGRLEHYAFPVLPALSLLVGLALSREEEDRYVTWSFRILAALGTIILLAAIGLGVLFVIRGGGSRHVTALRSDMVSETDFSILADMPPAIIQNLLRPAALAVVSLALGFFAASRFERRGRRLSAVSSLAAVMVVVFGMAYWSLRICEDVISSKRFAVAVAEQAAPRDRLVVVGDYESANSLNFYEPLPVEVTQGVAYALIPGMKFTDSARVVLSKVQFETAWRSGRRMFAIMPKAQRGKLDPAGEQILEVLDRVLIRNH